MLWQLLYREATIYPIACCCGQKCTIRLFVAVANSNLLYYLSLVAQFELLVRVKGKVVLLQAWCGPEGSRRFNVPRFSWHSAHQGGEVVSLTHRPPLPPGMFLVLIFTMGWVEPRAMVRLEGNVSLKNPVTPPGIDPGTVRLVAQRLNHYTTPGPTAVRVPLTY